MLTKNLLLANDFDGGVKLSLIIDSSLSTGINATLYCDYGYYENTTGSYPPKTNRIYFDTMYTFDCNIRDSFTLSGSPNLEVVVPVVYAPERGVLAYSFESYSDCEIKYQYFGVRTITITGNKPSVVAYATWYQ